MLARGNRHREGGMLANIVQTARSRSRVGRGLLEYGLLNVLIAVVAMALLVVFGVDVSALFETIAQNL